MKALIVKSMEDFDKTKIPRSIQAVIFTRRASIGDFADAIETVPALREIYLAPSYITTTSKQLIRLLGFMGIKVKETTKEMKIWGARLDMENRYIKEIEGGQVSK